MVGKIGKLVVSLGNISNTVRWVILRMIVSLGSVINVI